TSEVQVGPKAWWESRLLDTAFRPGTLALLDQAVVSGTSFLTTVLVKRMGGGDELGVYALGFNVVVLLICVQESLIAWPYTVYGNRLRGAARAEYAGSVLVHQGLLSALATVGLAVTAALLAAGIGPPGLAGVMAVLAGVMPLLLWREFG